MPPSTVCAPLASPQTAAVAGPDAAFVIKQVEAANFNLKDRHLLGVPRCPEFFLLPPLCCAGMCPAFWRCNAVVVAAVARFWGSPSEISKTLGRFIILEATTVAAIRLLSGMLFTEI